jgi:hypothetical protein
MNRVYLIARELPIESASDQLLNTHDWHIGVDMPKIGRRECCIYVHSALDEIVDGFKANALYRVGHHLAGALYRVKRILDQIQPYKQTKRWSHLIEALTSLDQLLNDLWGLRVPKKRFAFLLVTVFDREKAAHVSNNCAQFTNCAMHAPRPLKRSHACRRNPKSQHFRR